MDDEIQVEEPRVILPLERYSIKQKDTINQISVELEKAVQDLQKFDAKISRASSQNMGTLSTCGNCHLKLGHTKKSCTFSPCKSAFSCGNLGKHSDEKSHRTALERETSSLRVKLSKARKDVDDANRAAEKFQNSVSKRIEDVVINEMPEVCL